MPCDESPQTRCRMALAHGDITPPVGIYHRMWGAATHDRAEGIHRPLRATVLLLLGAGADAASARQAIIALDHCLFGAPEMNLLLDAVTKETTFRREEIVVVFSHTHGAGLMSLDRHDLPGGDLIEPYLQDVARRVIALLNEAVKHVEPVTLVYGTGHCDLAKFRDFWDEERQQFVCGFDPQTPADDTLLVARATNDAGQTVATLVNYACHPTTLAWENRLISPDYIGAMREVIEATTQAPCLFLQGASGELGPREGFVGDPAVADRNGRQLGYAALGILTALSPPRTRFEYTGPVVSGATLGAWQHVALSPDRIEQISGWSVSRWNIPLAYRPELPTIPDVLAQREHWHQEEQAAHTIGDTARGRDCRAMLERQTRMLARLQQLPVGQTYPLEVILGHFGDAVWIAVPGEHYSLLQTALRQRFPQTPIIIMTLANGWGPSYIPTEETYGKGIYQESIAIVAAGSLEKLVEELADRVVRNV